MSERISIKPDICNGRPVVRGTRITVQTVLEFLAAGDSVEDDIVKRLNDAVAHAASASVPASSSQIEEVQSKIQELKEKGLLKREKYAAATNEDFQKLFLSSN